MEWACACVLNNKLPWTYLMGYFWPIGAREGGLGTAVLGPARTRRRAVHRPERGARSGAHISGRGAISNRDERVDTLASLPQPPARLTFLSSNDPPPCPGIRLTPLSASSPLVYLLDALRWRRLTRLCPPRPTLILNRARTRRGSRPRCPRLHGRQAFRLTGTTPRVSPSGRA